MLLKIKLHKVSNHMLVAYHLKTDINIAAV